MSKIGIDISQYQTNVNYNEVAKNISFAILRIGYGVQYIPEKQRDKQFDNHYAGLYGKIPLGGYYYSYAKKIGDGRKEAENCLKYLNGRTLELPIYYDLEDKSMANIEVVAREFVDTIKNAGYKAGIYCNMDWARNKINLDNFKDYSIWIAMYGSNNGEIPSDTPSVSYDIWQYSSKGKINGINGNVDVDISNDNYGETTKETKTEVVTPHSQYTFEDFTLAYQKAYNEVYGAKYGRLVEDGLRGPATRASLSHIYLAKGQRNSLVKWCQDRLINHKHYTIPYGADGVFGSGTENIVKQFQKDNGLAVDGIIGKNTINLLF